MFRLIGCFALLCSAEVASAQGHPSRLGTREPARINSSNIVDATRAMSEFAKCSVARNPEAIESILNMPVDSSKYEKRIERELDDYCVSSGEIEMPMPIIRGGLFEALYRQKFAASTVDLSGARFDYAAVYSRPYSERAATALTVDGIGDCIVRSDVANARKMILSIPATSSENDATVAIVGRLPACLPQGQTFRFSRSMLRAAVAVALYRLTSVASQQALATQ